MTDFLVKSTISMGLLLALYHLLLQGEKMHRFNRLYLLLAVAFSLALPFITIEVYTEVVSEPMPVLTGMPLTPVTMPQAETIDYLPYIAWGAYGLITLLLALRFTRNILQFRQKISRNETISHEGAVLVLLDEPVLPHTFLNYIFINKADYENRLIEKELFTHELAHVNQKHTLDILFIESLKTIFWFNPLLYFYKKAIQLNQEFLADEIVVTAGDDVISYQQLLLQKATPVTYYQLASSLNFSVTKKRFTMMTKATTRSRALVLKLASLPVVAGLVIFLCIESVAQEKKGDTKAETVRNVKKPQTDDDRRDAYYKGVQVIIHNEAENVKIDKLFEELTEEEKDKYMFYAPEPYVVKHPSKEEFEKFKNKKGYGLQIDGKDVDNSVLNKYKPEDFAYYAGYTMSKRALTKERPQIFRYQLYTLPYFEKHLKGKNSVYPDKVFRMTITKEIKDDVVIAPAPQPKRVSSWEEVEEYLQQEDEVFSTDKLDPQPEFPGGVTAFYSTINKEFNIPTINEDITAKIYVSFVVEKDGSMSDVKILRDPGHGLGDEALRVLKKINGTTKWKPGMRNGKAVRASLTLPITINIKK